ncbi:MAG: LAGLIDADG family homing endonuclease [Promethearchaeota archaeon]
MKTKLEKKESKSIKRHQDILAYLVGALADGSIYYNPQHYIYRVTFYQKSKQYLTHCIEPCVFQLFDKQGHYYHDNRKDVYYYEVTSKAVYFEMKEAIGSFKDKNQRSIPLWIINGDKAVRHAFIRGFFDADGFYYIKPDNSDYRVRFGQADQLVLENLRDILSQEGFKCSDVLGPYQLKPNAKPYYELHVYGRNQMLRFQDLIRPCHPNKQLDALAMKKITKKTNL